MVQWAAVLPAAAATRRRVCRSVVCHPSAVRLAEALPLPIHRLTLEEKFALCRSVGEECIQEGELLRMLEKKVGERGARLSGL